MEQSVRSWITNIRIHASYIRREDKDFQIITVWVDNLLLFATTDNGIEHIKKEIASRWRVTDLGEPSKIIGIKIMHSDDSIAIL